ncbi:heavy metal translocating P-type ATPase [Sporomusa acidovorans]|uniref:Zinc-transporting ATPase n=1 Tax=Sporomusa acidovorans (strain ATCC 49682 / DSM 3132 / Mol) TaxID=1123286 RepID=A0ABZ3J1X6_SPOA4|nr:heavy metal translocating P-type ATPase [Sporomusa acidovorans]OZC14666.1 zinc-transporting ATPase [Sporomusa acidovorans DSM 3132]SDF85860.1 Cd2+/Zn2+-exporting ATPase [Sporomusa acidovorans]
MNGEVLAAMQVEKTMNTIWERHGAALTTVISAMLALLAWYLGTKGWMMWEIYLYTAAYVIGGYRKAWEGLQTLIKERDLDVDFLMIVAAIGAASIGYWQDGAILILIFALSGALEGYTLVKTNKDIRSIMKLRPETAQVLRGNTATRIRVEELQPGDFVLVKPGERIPADGVIEQGYSAVDQASITGESIPVDKACGDEVFAGTINGQGALTISVTKSAEATLLARIIRLVQEAQSEMPPSQLFVEKFERAYVRVVVAVALLLMIIPPYVYGWPWDKTIYRAMIFLVVASPCALVSSIMPAILSGISNGARKGILFKGGVHLENIGNVKLVAFDKTGTLTEGKPKVTDIVSFLSQSEDELLRLTAAVETLSEHPIAQAIVQAAKERGLEMPQAAELQAIPGVGVHGMVDREVFRIGNLDCLQNNTLSADQQQAVKQLEKQGKTVIYVQAQKQLLGLLAIQDTLRPQARNAIRALRRMRIGVAMLTGDKDATGQAIGRQVDVDWIYAGLFPEQKVEMVKKLTVTHGKVAMVGDGVNDAPALATASVGIAMGAAGTDVALETANVVLMADDIEKVADAIELGRRTQKVMKQNIIFAMSVVLLLVIGTFLDHVNLPFGVIGHEGSTLLVIINGLRLLR